ncbi:PAS domain-containing sensor histidine kinase [Methylobacter sp.]|uniref:sensor histidine kinase n=1 Tax=Methylobacter sp. TaxID=2051955 RepID=UPI0011FB1B26|nr:PAS domain-containing sensor histidine kinase [Methylobacter sp.]TAK60512.1 MAG: PAS domain-containing sensor histidine kinase [Methylobacter sp.]
MSDLLNSHLNIEHIDDRAKALLDEHHEAIRKRAEIMLAHSGTEISRMSNDDIKKLLFEFQVHQIELRMQNEELNRAYQELAESRDDYAHLYDSSPLGYLTLNEAGLIQKANIAAATLLDCPRTELVNKRFGEFIHPSDQDHYYLFIHELLAKKNYQVLNAKIKHTNDSPTDPECRQIQFCTEFLCPCDKGKPLTYIECCARAVYDHKNALQIYLILNNVTERRQAQETIASLNEKLEAKIRRQTNELTATNLNLIKKVEELRRSKHQLIEREAKLNSIFNASVEGIITINLSDIIVSANAAVETIFGYKPEELIGCNISKLLHSSPSYYDPSYTLKFDGQIREIEGIHKNGGIVPLDLSVAEFSIDNIPYLTYIVRDTSIRKYREQQDKEHLDELAHVTRLGLMGEMASGIAHEVNQPLSAISSYTQASLNLITTENPDMVKLTEILYKAQQQALRAGQIIHRMREFVKSHSMHRSTTNVNALIHDAVSLCIAELKQNDIKLTFELENNLPLIDADHIQIEQVIINLIRNSIDALQNLPAKQQRELVIHSHLTLNDGVQIRVKDNGPGLNEYQKQKILTPFYTTKANGMGMGLSISRSLVEAHEGTLYFNSQLEKGSTFYFTLPIRRKSDERK